MGGMMQDKNPFKRAQEQPLLLRWEHMLNTEYHFEIILPLKGIVRTWGEKGSYLALCAQVLEDQDTLTSTLKAGYLIQIQLPLKGFENAWYSISYEITKTLTDLMNVRLTINKKTSRKLLIHTVSHSQPTDEQITFASHWYPEMQKESVIHAIMPIKKNKVEEL